MMSIILHIYMEGFPFTFTTFIGEEKIDKLQFDIFECVINWMLLQLCILHCTYIGRMEELRHFGLIL